MKSKALLKIGSDVMVIKGQFKGITGEVIEKKPILNSGDYFISLDSFSKKFLVKKANRKSSFSPLIRSSNVVVLGSQDL